MNIEFIPCTEFAEKVLIPPKPAKNCIPEWYKKMPKFIEGQGNTSSIALGNNQATNSTLKLCTPFLDAMTTGYIWELPLDIEIRRNHNNEISFRWMTQETYITSHDKEQHPTLPVPNNAYDFVMKWAFDFVIKTPAGYSTLFTHPFNRNELPFVTFSGIVDTDKYQRPVQFPFQLINMNRDILIIEKGTPLCQFIPFKRDDWKSYVGQFDEIREKKSIFDLRSKIVRSYKNQFWSKKQYN